MNACGPGCGWCGRCTDRQGDEPAVKVRGVCGPCGTPLAHPKKDTDGVVRCERCRVTMRRTA